MTMTANTVTTWDKAKVKAAVDEIEQWVDRVEDHLKINGDDWLKENAPAALGSGSMSLDWELKVIEAAEAGDLIAHKSLVAAYWEAIRAGKTPSPFVASYVGRAELRPEPRRKQGKHTPHRYAIRDSDLMILVALTCHYFGRQPTRNREARRARQPCGTSLVAAAVRRRGIEVSEMRLTNMWGENGGERGFAAASQYRAWLDKTLGPPAA